jgi:peptidyl-prolyl cis-trans isomerase SurA
LTGGNTNMHSRLIVVLSVLAVACFASCRSKQAGAPAAVTADTWAVVDGRQITRDDVEKAFRRAQNTSQALSDEESLAAKLTLLDELILQEILLTRAQQLKIEMPDSEVDTAYADAKKNMADDAFQQELTRRQLTAADMREGLRRELLARKVVEREVTSKITVTDQDVSDFFNANRAQFNIAEESYRVAQIVVTPVREPQSANRAGSDAATPEAAAAKVRMLVERLKAGAPFSDLARDYSEDPESAPRGGDLGFVPISAIKQTPPQLRDAVLNKAPGSIDVVTAGGAHTIVLVVAREPAGQRDLSMPAVRQNITDTIRGRREQVLRTAYLTAARTDADVVNYFARKLVESQGKPPSLLPASPAAR